MQIDLSQRVALVTGAAQGIGKTIARQLQYAGAKVELTDCDQTGLAAAAAVLALPAHCVDLANRAEVKRLVNTIEQRYDRLDIVVNAAGGVVGQSGQPLEQIIEADWRALFAANVDSAFWLAQAVAPLMKRAAYGRLLYIASGAGLRPSLTGIQAYTAAKHALVGLTKQLSHELGPFGVTVNAIAPGLVLSNPSTQQQWRRYSADGQAQIINSIHTRRLGTANDIAAAAVFLVSDAAAWISGQILSVDGGRS